MVRDNRNRIVSNPCLMFAKSRYNRIWLSFLRSPFSLTLSESPGQKTNGKIFSSYGIVLLYWCPYGYIPGITTKVKKMFGFIQRKSRIPQTASLSA